MSVRVLGFGSVGRRVAELCDVRGIAVTHVSDSVGACKIASVASAIANKKQGKLATSPDLSILDGASNFPLLEKAMDLGMGIVLANKKPLTASPDLFKRLAKHRNARFEATCGAGLPVILTAQRLIRGGDKLAQVQGQLSGTLGFVLSNLEQPGSSFSATVAKAEQLGYTEPDPRDDLGGTDVARKALILARLGFGMVDLELKDIAIEALYPKEFGALPSVAEFRARLPELDLEWKNRVESARGRGKVWRYTASVTTSGVKVGLVEVDQSSPLGGLKGTLNLVQFTSEFYSPGKDLVVLGPGAGVDVTASGVVSDIAELV
ncbi:hypothetical protein BASA81_017561 [Batrachochytrium salamandrivorans]|nr:hypothetical protein BASA81_017561 [Batrachochytrium salamandrivorans]